MTAITGTASFGTAEELAQLSCLETVGDDLTIAEILALSLSLWPLRNLRKVGGSVDVNSTLPDLWVDCGFQNLQIVGEKYYNGAAIDIYGSGVRGELDLSKIQAVTNIHIKTTNLSRIILPSNVALTMWQFFLDTNFALSAIDGFENVALTELAVAIPGVTSLRIVDNSLLSTCRANALRSLFVAAGFSASDMELSGNLPDCP